MSISLIGFGLMALVSILFMAATVAGESNIKLPELKQFGDSSLGMRSVNWLGAMAFIGAVLICMA
jgi:formate-dependent nitrite reductase membrane component NrfD